MMNVTVIIPVYNDSESLIMLIDRIEKANQPGLKFLIVDNGSKEEFKLGYEVEKQSNLECVRTEQNLGFGGGILFGIRQARTEFVGWMPGNLKVDPLEVSEMLLNFDLNPKSFIKAKRSGRSIIPRLKTLLAGSVQSLLLRTNMLDSGGTPTICSKEFVLGLSTPPSDYVFESYLLFQARKTRMEIHRPRVDYGIRKFGQSHWQRGLRSELRLLAAIYKASRQWRKESKHG